MYELSNNVGVKMYISLHFWTDSGGENLKVPLDLWQQNRPEVDLKTFLAGDW